jgi:outer membrane immunogenic protein
MVKAYSTLGAVVVSCALAASAAAGPTPLPESKEAKEVAPAPTLPPCNWQGFYLGLHAGGDFGDSTATDFEYNVFPARDWSYDVAGFNGGIQTGYNLQPWRMLVVGVETDLGYLGLNGNGAEPASPGHDTVGKTESDFYLSWRGRVGVALDRWLLFATGGGIAVNYEARVVDDCDTGNCGGTLGSGSSSDFRLGWTVGAGVEYCFSRHWSAKVEYLYFDLENDRLHFHDNLGGSFPFDAETDGHIFRTGLNFRF